MANIGFIKSSHKLTTNCVQPILVPESFTHSIAFGQTGSGKTSSYIYPNLQSRLRLGHGILVYDYKGKEHLRVKYLASEAGRLDDVVEIGKPWGEHINIIQNMDEDELDKFLDSILKHSDEHLFWHNSAKSLGQSIFKILNAIEGFSKSIDLIDSDFSKSTSEIHVGKYWYPKQKTLSSLVKVCKTNEELEKFINNLPDLIDEVDDIIDENIKIILLNKKDIKRYKNYFRIIVDAKKTLQEAIASTKDSLDSFGENSNPTLTQNIIGSLTAPLLTLSQNRHFNDATFDIASSLNRGQIVVVQTESLSDAAIESLNNTVLYELSKRSRKNDLNPISIFIDEVQRVISRNTDIPIDILRDAKVDMFLATQNSALLKDKLQTEKFEALMGNLTSKYYFTNSSYEEIDSINNLSLLKDFEYICSSDNYEVVYSSEPIFMNYNKLLEVEYLYQKNLNLLNDYLYEHKREKIVLDYDARLYKDNKIIGINMLTLKEKIYDSYSKNYRDILNSEVDKLFDKNINILNALYDENDYEDELQMVS